ncbi:MAG: ABC transporter ATP-binding protein [Candidatus Heimdallarchaeota archaeon]|nr:MAG: ABC transporter ATP-binding protein [Candidatus Heimdallarchaeota archaeon]
MRENILVLKDVHKIYGEGTPNEVHALRGVNLQISKGEMVAVMGPSGCGKTTMLNICGGLDSPTSGTIQINGVDISTYSDGQMTTFRRDNIGYVFQLFNLFDYMSALENVMVPLLAQGFSYPEATRRATMILREVGLGDRIYHSPPELSGGQQQRVAISRALVTQPAIILGDEPTGDLDSVTSEDLMDMFKRINTDNRQTLIIVTHSEWIGEQCERIIRLRDGEVVEDC